MKDSIDLAAETFIVKIPSFLRWALIFPSAVVGAKLATLPFSYLTLIPIFGVGLSSSLLVGLVQSATLGVGFVAAGAIMAPKFQFPVSIILIISVVIYNITVFDYIFNIGHTVSWQLILQIIMLIFGGGLASYHIHKDIIS